MKSRLKKIKVWFLSLFRIKYKTVWIEDLPRNLKKRNVYILGGRKYPFQAVFLCPKNCKKKIFLNVSKQHKKWERWKITEHKDGTISLSPSIHMKTLDCNCHYWFKRGQINWTGGKSGFLFFKRL